MFRLELVYWLGMPCGCRCWKGCEYISCGRGVGSWFVGGLALSFAAMLGKGFFMMMELLSGGPLAMALSALIGSAFAFALAAALHFSAKARFMRKARLEADSLIHSKEEAAEALIEKSKALIQRQRQAAASSFQAESQSAKRRIAALRREADQKSIEHGLQKKKAFLLLEKTQKEREIIRARGGQIDHERRSLMEKMQHVQKGFLAAASRRFDLSGLREEVKASLLERFSRKTALQIEKWERDRERNLEKTALFCLQSALSRFAVPYCPEKGIEKVSFASLRHLQNSVGPSRSLLSRIEEACGVDAAVFEDELCISILGIDPVRRELGRSALRKLSKVRRPSDSHVDSCVRKAKKELFARIRRDGRAVFHSLRLPHPPEAVKNMMGALRYRYSFAQNQRFHCEEVGWLCGLLSAELGLPLEKGRRAGLLHDIGKAMDHSMEGNHAVIGANFIEKHGEEEDIVHAVRAHHHDTAPSSALAFLVIAADAVSGSRPGARRFTEDSYAKKLAHLEQIADSFPHIQDAYIMSAGREMRIIVQEKKVSDKGALQLSHDVARKIERECAYPGLIKVTVVRRSEVQTFAQ